LQAALARYDELVERLAAIDRQGAAATGPDAALVEARKEAAEACDAIRSRVDQVAGQRGATVSRLYWYTDLEQAKLAAAERGVPILSLRMLGKLTDEFSCANSRFFRTALYSNKEISGYLRDNFVLHWQSVRPVPRIIVDFGDGRRLERTITGNSAHYVLDAQGRPLDALPGLYGPQAFGQWLRRSHDFALRLANVADAQRGMWLTSYHSERLGALNEALGADLAQFAPELVRGAQVAPPSGGVEPVSVPTAGDAARRAVAKCRAETPLVAPFLPSGAILEAQSDELWQRIATGHSQDAKLDEASVAVIQQENPTAAAAGRRAITKAAQENPLIALFRNFEGAMALDGVKNEYLLHRRIHEWFAGGEAPAELDALNERVYADLFLTPSSDPWLGLAPADVYTALDGGGITEP
jgi:hypothetical protein